MKIVRTASETRVSNQVEFVFEPYLLDIVLCMYVCTTERKRWRGGVMRLAAYLTQAFLRDFFGCCFRWHAHALMIRRVGWVVSNQSCCNERERGGFDSMLNLTNHDAWSKTWTEWIGLDDKRSGSLILLISGHQGIYLPLPSLVPSMIRAQCGHRSGRQVSTMSEQTECIEV